MEISQLASTWSKDASTKVGCVIRDEESNTILVLGYNGLPRKVQDTWQRLQDRDLKLQIVVHAEANAVANAARKGISLIDSTAYITQPPCSSCAALLIQVGIKRIVCNALAMNSKWRSSVDLGRVILKEAGVQYDVINREEVVPGLIGKAHGVNCLKSIHTSIIETHDSMDDRPFMENGIIYCGRCHEKF